MNSNSEHPSARRLSPPTGIRRWGVLALAWIAGGIVTYAQGPSAGKFEALLVSIQGRVDTQKAGSATWERAQTNRTLQVHDRIRTGPRSRVTLQLSNQSVQRLDELTTLELLPAEATNTTPQLELKEGGIYFFNREKGTQQKFKTPLASGAILGTEFALRVAPDGSTRVALMEGRIDLGNAHGSITITPGDGAEVVAGSAPRKTARLDARAAVQWCLYYPAVVVPDELELTPDELSEVAESMDAYRSGDVISALAALPTRFPSSDGVATFAAALSLAAGQVDVAEFLLKGRVGDTADAVRVLIASVGGSPPDSRTPSRSASLLLANSYAAQAAGHLDEALNLARMATVQAPGFGATWIRLAELEFSFGRTGSAGMALQKGLTLSPRNAQGETLRGFTLAAANRISRAEAAFDRAIQLDGGLANGWLGRGLCRIKQGAVDAGRNDLQVAAATEPDRALLRSYLGKAWSESGDTARAAHELQRSHELDPADPTGWLYSALLNQQGNRVNEAVEDLEKSKELNDRRSVYRSSLLLDQDRAMRSANLAGLYRDAGMTERSVREASRAVEDDYGNFSAHRFLADSYDTLRDPRQFNLRYETPWFTELLLANLLAPVGAGSLSQYVSQQEYSRLLEQDRLGLSSTTEYWGHGDWHQVGSQFGTIRDFSYSLDTEYRSQRGWAPNTDGEQLSLYGKFKFQLSPSDSAFAMINYNDYENGDTRQLRDPHDASPGLRITERQYPNVFLGWHHEWAPGQHSLLLAGRLAFDQHITDTNTAIPLFIRANAIAPSTLVQNRRFVTDLRREFDLVGVEGQHIATLGQHSLIAGVRYQAGELENTAFVKTTGGRSQFPPADIFPRIADGNRVDVDRLTLYAYDTWKPWEPLALTAGVTYDQLQYPENVDLLPLATAESTTERLSPKAGITWSVGPETHLRAAWSRSLGGVSYDNSIRLEPIQIAGFNQAYRSLIPESVAGVLPGADFETLGVGVDHKFPTRTYLSASAERLTSDGRQSYGAFDWTRNTLQAVPSTAQRNLDYEEVGAGVTVNQLLGNRWSVGLGYHWTEVDLDSRVQGLPVSLGNTLDTFEESILHQATLSGRFYLECGFFAQANATWTRQASHGYRPSMPGEDFWQLDVYAGHRFWQRRAEVRVGVLNLTDDDYRLNPLTVHEEYVRARTFYTSLRLYF